MQFVMVKKANYYNINTIIIITNLLINNKISNFTKSSDLTTLFIIATINANLNKKTKNKIEIYYKKF